MIDDKTVVNWDLSPNPDVSEETVSDVFSRIGTTMKNRLVIIGLRGIKTAYMNMSREDAIRAFFDSKAFGPTEHAFFTELLKKGELVKEFEFNDNFRVCDAWAQEEA